MILSRVKWKLRSESHSFIFNFWGVPIKGVFGDSILCKLPNVNIPPLGNSKTLYKEDSLSVRWALNPRTLSPMKLMSPTPGRKPRKCFRKSAHKNTQTVSKHIQIHLTCSIKHCNYKGKSCPRGSALHLLEQLKFGGRDTILPQKTCKLSR